MNDAPHLDVVTGRDGQNVAWMERSGIRVSCQSTPDALRPSTKLRTGFSGLRMEIRTCLIELSIIEDSAGNESNSMQNPPYRHSRESGNPVFKQSPRSGQHRICGVFPLPAGGFYF